ncbi:hypothetical protein GT347_16205 [Xylophilus rhododendri]|uniref:Uncharacterized protein n=1 Tax=Xylophilus rhododendri TaxID=2697032 RepID=A0A857J9F5_9BURK|nr:hypothetical protein [Xylophilus rhododendri]QHI99385.1 hypothetical protein GT347_16205 [Xylophilus rhododendri]
MAVRRIGHPIVRISARRTAMGGDVIGQAILYGGFIPDRRRGGKCLKRLAWRGGRFSLLFQDMMGGSPEMLFCCGDGGFSRGQNLLFPAVRQKLQLAPAIGVGDILGVKGRRKICRRLARVHLDIARPAGGDGNQGQRHGKFLDISVQY